MINQNVFFTSNRFRRFVSHKLRQPISRLNKEKGKVDTFLEKGKNLPVDMYQPLKAQPGNTKPPQSKSMLETANHGVGGEKIRLHEKFPYVIQQQMEKF